MRTAAMTSAAGPQDSRHPRSPGSEDVTADRITVECQVVEGTTLPPDIDPPGIEDLGRFVLGEEGGAGTWVVTVVLTGNAHLRELHRDFLGIDTETDVMTFPWDEQEEADHGGDIVVSVDQAEAQASDFGLTPAEELRFLVVHGLLHLCGRDDATEDGRAAMLEEQRVLIDAYDRRSAANPPGQS